MSASYSVRLTKEHHVFSAAHFITFNRDVCERLHGHNYRVNVVVYGPLDENQYVVDFIALRDELKALTDALDHRMLLPTGHPLLSVAPRTTDHGPEIEVVFAPDGRRWVFPAGDCAILPIANTTAELLARYLGEQLLTSLSRRLGTKPAKIRVEVDENHGQWGVCELTT
ncbi:MAG: 6-pyruvoyl tetrahydropterin synthase family protein [Pirellulaceae bacterium]|nr:6-pyruvoyl tetrahydropterin synthase family protein [Pirellulaceae bacterium]